MLTILAEMVLSMLRYLVEIPLIWIGEIVRFLVSFGRHEPRWDAYVESSGSDFAFFYNLSLWIGIFTVCGIGGAVKFFFFT